MLRRKGTVTNIKKTTISSLLKGLTLFLIVWSTSCRQTSTSIQYVELSKEGMGKGDCLQLTPEVNDSIASYYDVVLHVRYNNEYPYNKLHLQINHSSLIASDSTVCEEIAIEMNEEETTAQFPQWEYIRQKQVLLKQHVCPDKNCTVSIKHLMNDALLPGLLNIGIELIPSKTSF